MLIGEDTDHNLKLAAQAGVSMPEHYWRISREAIQGKHFSRIDKIDMASLQ